MVRTYLLYNNEIEVDTGILDELLTKMLESEPHIYVGGEDKFTFVMMCPYNINHSKLSKKDRDKMFTKMTLTERLKFNKALKEV